MSIQYKKAEISKPNLTGWGVDICNIKMLDGQKSYEIIINSNFILCISYA
jgi:hypothetical protein